jgi:hypothetical protein
MIENDRHGRLLGYHWYDPSSGRRDRDGNLVPAIAVYVHFDPKRHDPLIYDYELRRAVQAIGFQLTIEAEQAQRADSANAESTGGLE